MWYGYSDQIDLIPRHNYYFLQMKSYNVVMIQVMKFYEESSRHRTAAKTARNERSSRSHAIFRLNMSGRVIKNDEGQQDTCSGINNDMHQINKV